jgi:hypothetical protein
LGAISNEFEWDGSLRDIYIFKTSLDDWQKPLDFIRAGRYTFEYKMDGDAVDLPERAAIDTLDDWGWAGDETKAPVWYTGKPWS